MCGETPVPDTADMDDIPLTTRNWSRSAYENDSFIKIAVAGVHAD